MKKRLISFGLAAIMALSLTTMALAQEPGTERAGSDAAIEFRSPFTDGAFNPDPGDEDEDLWGPDDGRWNLAPLNLDFGIRDIETFTRTYNALIPFIDYRDQRATPESTDRVPGRSRNDDAAAGIYIVAMDRDNFILNVAMSDFYIGQNATMQGWTMNLTQQGSPVIYGDPELTPEDLNLSIFGASGLSADTNVNVWSGSRGIAGVEFNADMEVLGLTADEGEAQAVMTWSFVAGA